MNLVVFSHKPCWLDERSPSGYATDGGFPFQMAGLAGLFDRTTLVVAERSGSRPEGLTPLEGHALHVSALPEPAGVDWRRKLALLHWLPRNLPKMWSQVRQADAVHAPIPGDLGTLGLLLALLHRRPLFVRHCGTWASRRTLTDRFLAWLLPRIAGPRNVVMATGSADAPPAGTGGDVAWIFSTTLSSAELRSLAPAPVWRPGTPLRLVTVGRLTDGKNAASIVAALPRILRSHPETTLDIAGDGPCRAALAEQARALGLEANVVLHGNLSHARVMQLLGRSHLFVFPTRVPEGFPKAVLEALACGVPVLAPRVSAIPHMLSAGGGWLLEDTDATAVAAAVSTSVTDPEELHRRGLAARRTAASYTLEAWGELIRQRLEQAWGQPLSSRPLEPKP